MEVYDFEPWVDIVAPYEGESISHFLGRFERANQWTAYQIGQVTKLGGVISRWKKLYLNPFPSSEELQAIAAITELTVEQWIQMLPPKGITMQPRPIRLCGACYQESPFHRIEWQFQEKISCDRHNLRLLSKCTNCETRFPIPAEWDQGECSHCSLPFAKMAKRQKTA